MVFKSDKQRKGFFGSRGNPRAGIQPKDIFKPTPRELKTLVRDRRLIEKPKGKTTFSKVSEISDAFATGLRSGKARADARFPEGRVFISGDTIFSFGRHFPIAVKTGEKIAVINKDKFSVTTTKQQSQVALALSRQGFKTREVGTAEIKDIVDRRGDWNG